MNVELFSHFQYIIFGLVGISTNLLIFFRPLRPYQFGKEKIYSLVSVFPSLFIIYSTIKYKHYLFNWISPFYVVVFALIMLIVVFVLGFEFTKIVRTRPVIKPYIFYVSLFCYSSSVTGFTYVFTSASTQSTSFILSGNIIASYGLLKEGKLFVYIYESGRYFFKIRPDENGNYMTYLAESEAKGISKIAVGDGNNPSEEDGGFIYLQGWPIDEENILNNKYVISKSLVFFN